MWAIVQGKNTRHFWGGDGRHISLCHLKGAGSLDYARGASLKKCFKCQKELGRKHKKEIPNGTPLDTNL